MERDNEHCPDLIELGAATVETRGVVGKYPDYANGQMGTALSDD